VRDRVTTENDAPRAWFRLWARLIVEMCNPSRQGSRRAYKLAMNSPMNAISLTLNPPVFTKFLQDCAVRARNDVGSVTIQSSLRTDTR
jgi:hypothetical protein